MFFLQQRDMSTGQWERVEDVSFSMALEALERRDDIMAKWPHDGLRNQRGIRVVDTDGRIIEYKKIEI